MPRPLQREEATLESIQQLHGTNDQNEISFIGEVNDLPMMRCSSGNEAALTPANRNVASYPRAVPRYRHEDEVIQVETFHQDPAVIGHQRIMEEHHEQAAFRVSLWRSPQTSALRSVLDGQSRPTQIFASNSAKIPTKLYPSERPYSAGKNGEL